MRRKPTNYPRRTILSSLVAGPVLAIIPGLLTAKPLRSKEQSVSTIHYRRQKVGEVERALPARAR